jgi:cobalt-zinc-cadmium efflux system protein
MSVDGHGAACGHDHGHHHHGHAHGGAAGSKSVRRMALSLALTAAVMVAEAVGGWVSGSLALLSDAGHMLTDAVALGLALVAMILAARPADPRRTFGFRRAEVLAAQLNVAFLVVLSLWIAYEAVERLRDPLPAINLPIMATIAAIGLAGNVAILFWLHEDHSLNARSAFLHVLSDAIASVAVLLAAAVMFVRPEMRWVDPALSLGISLLILWGAGRLVLEITHILMEGVPSHLDVDAVCKAMCGAAGVVTVHDVHIWTISSGLYALSAHVVVDSDAVGRNDDILHDVKERLRRVYGIDHTTLQIESVHYEHVHDVHTH